MHKPSSNLLQLHQASGGARGRGGARARGVADLCGSRVDERQRESAGPDILSELNPYGLG